MWISLVVPLAVLLAAMLLQRLEAALLTAPKPAEHPTDDPAAAHPPHTADDAAPAFALVPQPGPPAPPRRRRPGASAVRATA